MEEQQLDAFFLAHHFQPVTVNAAGLRAYRFDAYESQKTACFFVVVYFCENMFWFRERQENIARQIKNKYSQNGIIPVYLLSIAATDKPQEARELFREGEEYWILDTRRRRLMLYEKQGDFCGLKKPLEEALFSGSILSGADSKNVLEENQKSNNTEGFNIHPILGNTAIIIINIAVFLAFELFGRSVKGQLLYSRGALDAERVIKNQEYYRLLTCMFLHSGMDHIVNNMLILWFLGGYLERQAGHIKFLILYFATGILAGIASMSYNIYIGRHVVSVGASGAIFGVVGAVAVNIFLHRKEAKELTARKMFLFLVLSIYGGFTTQGIDNVAHIGGAISGMVLGFIISRREMSKQSRHLFRSQPPKQ